MKRNFILAAVLVAALAGCNQRDPASLGMVQQCGLDAQTNSNKCVWVYPQQVQQGQVMQQSAPNAAWVYAIATTSNYQ
jgi:outer membrane protein assembly factor BamE (lipoprotein component of BamABCDE complex)